MDNYREKAEECLHIAEKMRSPVGRIEMLSIARRYMALATCRLRREEAKRPHDWGPGSGSPDRRKRGNSLGAKRASAFRRQLAKTDPYSLHSSLHTARNRIYGGRAAAARLWPRAAGVIQEARMTRTDRFLRRASILVGVALAPADGASTSPETSADGRFEAKT
jgi:hypothetical protein